MKGDELRSVDFTLWRFAKERVKLTSMFLVDVVSVLMGSSEL